MVLAVIVAPIALALLIIALAPRAPIPATWLVALVSLGSLYVVASGTCVGWTAVDMMRVGTGDFSYLSLFTPVAIIGGIPFLLGFVMIRIGWRRRSRPDGRNERS